MADAAPGLRQRAELTHRGNRGPGRHGWLRLTPAYAVRIVDELLAGRDPALHVLDPFCGTATTALSAAMRGHAATTTDINPFLIWFGRAKTARYDAATLAAAAAAGADVAAARDIAPAPPPAIHNIGRWWGPEALAALCRLRAAIDAAAPPGCAVHDLLLVAFCRVLIGWSNAAFDHQSMSFRTGGATPDVADFPAALAAVLDGAAVAPPGSAQVLRADARDLGAMDGLAPVDLVVTSPPYANRMSYIRELRPYMYWLGYLTEARTAGELDWAAIGGTWGSATSRLATWERPADHRRCPILDAALPAIAAQGRHSSAILARYVARYCDDLWRHLQGMVTLLSPGAELHYILGNSSFYGVLLPVERICAAMLADLGCTDVACRPLRKRNSKRELVEFDVTARWRA